MRNFVIAVVVALLIGLGIRAGYTAGEDTILVCRPSEVPAEFAAEGWRVVTVQNHARIKSALKNKTAEMTVMVAGDCTLFEGKSGKRLSEARPVYFIFWRDGVRL